jgi:hypothetical protein
MNLTKIRTTVVNASTWLLDACRTGCKAVHESGFDLLVILAVGASLVWSPGVALIVAAVLAFIVPSFGNLADQAFIHWIQRHEMTVVKFNKDNNLTVVPQQRVSLQHVQAPNLDYQDGGH